jgi:mRNA interferase MazF
MARADYVPEAGDLVWINFDPQAGREQAGRRPALVLSPASYNGRSGLALACPITSQIKHYPFEVVLPRNSSGIQGAVLADHVKSLDWRSRRTERAGRASHAIITEVRERLLTLLGE